VQEIIILAGPNGAGKTTFANEYLPAAEEDLAFVNADEIARELDLGELPQGQRDMVAARLMLEEIDRLVAAQKELMFETTLATRTYARKIPLWKAAGYNVSLLYLRLPNAEHSILRVRRRLEAGGHGIPEDVIRRRHEKSLRYLEEIYKPLVDEWYIWDSLEAEFTLTESWDQA
jgi:predicted ABC-type ATPase